MSDSVGIGWRKGFRGFVSLAAVGSFVLAIVEILNRTPSLTIRFNSDNPQWDLPVYYKSPLVMAQGLDPYEVTHFVYPPIYLPLFRVFSELFTYDQFYWVFLFAKIFSFFALLFLWKSIFLKRTNLDIFVIFVWLGFNSTVLLDFQAGNISVFETLAIFLAFACFLRDRLTAFVFFVLVAASFKITPLFFLTLPLVAKRKHGLACLVSGCGIFSIFGLVNYFVFPEFTSRFIFEATQRVGDWGATCPSSLSFIGTIVTNGLAQFGGTAVSIVAKTIYAGFACLILWISWNVLRRERNSMTIVMFTVLVYVLAMPRIKDYAFMIAIPSVLYAIENLEIEIPQWLLFLPLVLVPIHNRTPVFGVIPETFWSYYPLFIALFFWWVYVHSSWKSWDLEVQER